jgi:hypothetical protein
LNETSACGCGLENHFSKVSQTTFGRLIVFAPFIIIIIIIRGVAAYTLSRHGVHMGRLKKRKYNC